MNRAEFSLVAASFLLVPWLALAQDGLADPCSVECGAEPGCLREQVSCLVGDGRTRDAITLLKNLHADRPDDGLVVRLLAWSYLESGNRIWATKTLLERLEAAPDDARSRAWAVWVLLEDGDLWRARRILDGAPAVDDGVDGRRLELLNAAALQLELRTERAASVLMELKGMESLYEADLALLEDLRWRVLGDRGKPVSARVQLAGGGSSNVIESAPQDLGVGTSGVRSPQAPIAALDAVFRFEPWVSPRLRPLVEIRAKGFTPFTDETEGFGYFTADARVGVEAGPAAGARGRALYGAELMVLRGDDDVDEVEAGMVPVEGGLIMEAHRGDLELDLSRNVQLFAGAGRRIYREMRRTRTEIDGGAAWVVPLASGWDLTALGTGRAHLARHSAWSAWGLTGLLRLRVPLPGDHMVKVRGMVLWDRWPEFETWESSVVSRDDLALRLRLGPWTRAFGGWRFGLGYNYATRISNFDDYDYTDHRGLVEVRWQGAWHPGLPSVVPVPEHGLALPYGLEGRGDQGLDRVQDLLRQEDSARRGSSCAE